MFFFCGIDRCGEIRRCRAEPLFANSLLAGQIPGRRADAEITLYKSLGHVVQDLACAGALYQDTIPAGTMQAAAPHETTG